MMGTAFAVTGGSESFFTRRLLVARSRQLIHLKRMHVSVAFEVPSVSSDSVFQNAIVLQTTPEEAAASGAAAPQSQISILWSKFTPAIAHRNRSTVIDFFRSSGRWNFGSNTGMQQLQVNDNWFPEYDFVVPAIHAHIGTQSTISIAAVEVFIRVEFEWVDATIDEIAAAFFHWGMDPQDMDREGI